MNPIAGMRHAAVVGYREEGGGFRGVGEGFNRGFNPMYFALIHTDQCIHAGDGRTRAMACAQAAVDIGTLGFGAGVAGRCLAAFDGAAFRAMLLDETGSFNPAARRFTPDQNTLIQLAKDAKRRGGLTADEASILKAWADEYGLPARGPEASPGVGFGSSPHYHIGPVGQVPAR